jgi:hypothetical protein
LERERRKGKSEELSKSLAQVALEGVNVVLFREKEGGI